MEARWLVEAAARKSAGGEAEVEAIAVDLARRRVQGEPLQYLTGIAGFRRLELAVGEGVLIPRPETEMVAERAMTRLPRKGALIDVGTGSGAIALSVADERPDARVWATDNSATALRWARRNSERLELPIELIEADLLDGLPPSLGGNVDVVVSNPPYVALAERALLPVEVAEYEPSEALFAGRRGMALIERLVAEAPAWLRAGGWLVLETSESQGESTSELLEHHGFVGIALSADLNGRQRIAEARRP